MTSKNTQLQKLIADEAEHAEATRGDPIPADALGGATRPNRAKSVMFSLRLSPDELTQLQAIAEACTVPASTLARGWIVQNLTAERGTASDTAAMLDRLENDLRLLRKLVAAR